MFWVTSIILVCIISIFINKNLINPASILLLVWSSILIIYQFNIGNLDQIAEGTYALIAVGLLGFCIGVALDKYGVKNTKIVVNSSKRVITSYHINYGFVSFLCFTSIVVLIPEAFSSIKVLYSGGTFETIRKNYSAGIVAINNSIIRLYRNYFVKPFLYIIYPLSAIDFLFGSRKKWLFVSAVALALLDTLYEGGRIQFVYLIIHFLLIMKLGGKSLRISIPKTAKKILVVLIAVTVGVLVYVTSSRGSSSTFLQTAIVYTSGCIPLLDKYLESMNFHPDYTFGLVSISGFLKPFFALLENVGFSYPQFLNNIQHVFEVEKTISIGSTYTMNAYVSQFYYLFYDGGYIGTFLLMIIYGMICEKSFKNANTLRGMLYYALIVQGLLFSMIRLQFTISHYCLSFILALFIFRTNLYGEKNEDSSNIPV